MRDRGDLILTKPIKIQKPIKRNPRGNRATRCLPTQIVQRSEIPEWLQEFRENLVDDEIPEHGDSHASSSHEASVEPILKRREDLCKHSVFFLISLKTEIARSVKGPKITRAPCRRRNCRSRTSC